MQQPVGGNRWLSPELLSLAEQRRTPAPPAPVTPSAQILTMDKQVQPPRHRVRPPRSAGRQWFLHVAAGLLLIGSAAFSYLAWSYPGTPGAARAVKTESIQTSNAVLHQQEIHALRSENHRLHARIAALREQLTST